MGLCASSQAAPDETQHVQPQSKPQPQQQQQQSQTTAAPKPASTTAAPAVAAAKVPSQPNTARSSVQGGDGGGASTTVAEDDEYRSQLKSIFLHLLDRLLQVMEHELPSASALAALRAGTSDASYLSLFGSDTIESFLRAAFDVDSVPATPPAGPSAEREQAFALLVQAASQRVDEPMPSDKPTLNRRDFTERIKVVCNATQVELKASLAVLEANAATMQRAGDLRKSLLFFTKTFNFTQGDIANDAKLLEKNIDEIISASDE